MSEKMIVTLTEGATYTLRGTKFVKGQPAEVSAATGEYLLATKKFVEGSPQEEEETAVDTDALKAAINAEADSAAAAKKAEAEKQEAAELDAKKQEAIDLGIPEEEVANKRKVETVQKVIDTFKQVQAKKEASESEDGADSSNDDVTEIG